MFVPDTPSAPAVKIHNDQLVRYAGYQQADGGRPGATEQGLTTASRARSVRRWLTSSDPRCNKAIRCSRPPGSRAARSYRPRRHKPIRSSPQLTRGLQRCTSKPPTCTA
ncbi:nitric oxide synthase oxygenase [Micromonospora aurantiaca]|uniref:nitric oxide synthase oxygenase n=1 Tax=Micromonospora aurantiaca (nom. illeg.) TaxID=47850 RepID=UPI0033C24135